MNKLSLGFVANGKLQSVLMLSNDFVRIVIIFNDIIVFNWLKFSGSYLGCLCTQSTIISPFRASLHYVQVCKHFILTKISQLYVSFL